MTSQLRHPVVPLLKLDELWFQITGTRCNLTCSHCFISCSPTNLSFDSLSRETVEKHLEESKALGVKEYYFTGGEPFLHPDIVAIIARTLEYGPATILTNGTVMTPGLAQALAKAADGSTYSLEFRVSIDHYEADKNDEIRGKGSFAKALRGISRLATEGFLPIVTAMRTWEMDEDLEVIDKLAVLLREAGVQKPRVKLLPALKIGAELERSGGYDEFDYVTEEMFEDFAVEQLVCSHSRVVTDRGVHVCPILIESDDSIMGQSIGEATGGFELKHQACSTCYLFGAFCVNPSAMMPETSRTSAVAGVTNRVRLPGMAIEVAAE
jgi:molybdenum cofactor biosynthesis enzyme MoaA